VDAETELAGAKGVILADQVKALDWRARNADLAARRAEESSRGSSRETESAAAGNLTRATRGTPR
jgi:mRNA-degrading endonuclease toxin of MazEF toxin-antitoxin module